MPISILYCTQDRTIQLLVSTSNCIVTRGYFRVNCKFDNSKTFPKLLRQGLNRSNDWPHFLTSIIEVILSVIISMIMKTLMLDIASFNCSLHTAVTTKPLAIPARPVDCILVPVVDPVLIILVDQHHTARSV